MNIDVLRMFCPESGAWGYDTPWVDGEWSYATDGRVLVRCPRIDGCATAILSPSAAGLFVKFGPVEPWVPVLELPPLVAPAPCSVCLGQPPPPCSACDGDGDVEWEYEHGGMSYEMEWACPVCDGESGPCKQCRGSGVNAATDPEQQPVPVLGRLVKQKYLRLIGALPGAELALSRSTTTLDPYRTEPVAFRAEGGVEGLVMAMREGAPTQ